MTSLLLLLAAIELTNVEFKPGLTLDASLPDKGKPRSAVVLVHGGGWEAGDKRTYIKPWFTTLTAAGIPWFTINYRLAPNHPHPAAVEDIEDAVRYIRKHYTKHLVLMGESAGGHLAALAAVRGKIKVDGLVSFYGIHDIPAWRTQRGSLPRNISLYLPRATDAQLREASPVTYLRPGQPPMLLVHGKADSGVPFAQSTEFCAAAKQHQIPCELLLIEGAPHGVENWESNPAFQIWKSPTVDWLRRHLR